MCVKCNIDNCSCNLTTGVRGRRGYKGDKGDPGVGVGIAGQSAYQAWLNNGHSGTVTDFLNWLRGSDGVDGIDGLTAYQIWLSKPGNAGKTEAEFLDSLIGPKGDTATVSVGNTTTLPAGDFAVVSVDLVNSTPTHTILDFEIPKGDKGDKGDQGDKGDVGTPGPNSLIYQYKTPIEAGACVLNNASFDSTTQVILSRTSMQGLTGTPFSTGNAQDWVDAIKVGARFQMYNMDDYSIFGIYTINNKVTSGSGDVTLTLLPIVTAGSVTVDTNLAVSYIIAPVVVPGSSQPDGIPVGVSWDFFGKSSVNVPSKWLLADGSTQLIANYPELFTTIGNIYGGDGVTTFALPDTRNKVTAGVGSVVGAIGDNVGAANVMLGDENLVHSHSVEEAMGATVEISTSGSHTHSFWGAGSDGTGDNNKGFDFTDNDSPSYVSQFSGGPSGYDGIIGGGHVHPKSSFVGDTAPNIDIVQEPVSLFQPTLVCRKIIKALP